MWFTSFPSLNNIFHEKVTGKKKQWNENKKKASSSAGVFIKCSGIVLFTGNPWHKNRTLVYPEDLADNHNKSQCTMSKIVVTSWKLAIIFRIKYSRELSGFVIFVSSTF